MIWINTPNESSVVSVSISTPQLEKEVAENLSRELDKIQNKLLRRPCLIITSYKDFHAIANSVVLNFSTYKATEEATYGRITLWNVQILPCEKKQPSHFDIYFEKPPVNIIHSRQYEICSRCQKQNRIQSNKDLWQNGLMICSEHVEIGLDETQNPPPKDCPFSAEHVVSLQRVFV